MKTTAAVLLALVLWLTPLAGEAQQSARIPRIGVVSENASTDLFLDAFRQGLRELGYIEGRNVVVEYRHAKGALDPLPGLVAELLRLEVDVLVVGGTFSARTAKAATNRVPIVFVTPGDPVATGLVANLAHPGGNATGMSTLLPEMEAKQLELLKSVTAQLSRVAVMWNPINPLTNESLSVLREAARTLGVDMRTFETRRGDEIASTFVAMKAYRPGALLVISDPVFGNELSQIARLAAEHRLPAIYARRQFAEAGGLLAYGTSFADNYRRAATYVDKILKGAKPGDLPVQQPEKFELVINVKTAKALGLTIPQPLLFRADQVID